MYQILAPTLFQNKTCRLPGIGILSMVSSPAQADFANNQIIAPAETIVFTEDRSRGNRFNEFSALSELLQKNLDEHGIVLLKGIGTFRKDAAGGIEFSPIQIDPVFNASVITSKVVRQNISNNELETQTDTEETGATPYDFDDNPVPRKNWWIWAIVLAAIGVIMLLIHYSQHMFDLFSNSNKVLK